MRIIVDHERCMCNGLCVSTAPHLFRLTGTGDVQVLDEHPPEAARDAALTAVRLCPTTAITVED
jgi:ferredoxin